MCCGQDEGGFGHGISNACDANDLAIFLDVKLHSLFLRTLIAHAHLRIHSPSLLFQPDLKTNGECVACYKGVPFTIEGKGVCTVKSMKGAPIK